MVMNRFVNYICKYVLKKRIIEETSLKVAFAGVGIFTMITDILLMHFELDFT